MVINSIGKKEPSQCEKCKHGKPLSREEFIAEMKESGMTVSISSEEWSCYKYGLRCVTKIDGVCQNREERENDAEIH